MKLNEIAINEAMTLRSGPDEEDVPEHIQHAMQVYWDDHLKEPHNEEDIVNEKMFERICRYYKCEGVMVYDDFDQARGQDGPLGVGLYLTPTPNEYVKDGTMVLASPDPFNKIYRCVITTDGIVKFTRKTKRK